MRIDTPVLRNSGVERGVSYTLKFYVQIKSEFEPLRLRYDLAEERSLLVER